MGIFFYFHISAIFVFDIFLRQKRKRAFELENVVSVGDRLGSEITNRYIFFTSTSVVFFIQSFIKHNTII